MLIDVVLITLLLLLFPALLTALFWPVLKTKAGGDFSAVNDCGGEISILIPARNEEANLPACLETVLRQGNCVLEVLIYNDHSIDRTGQIISEFSRVDSRVRAIEVFPLEAGWGGKNFACWNLARAARGKRLLFIDADARLSDGAAERMAEEMKRRRLSFLSCWPGLELISFWERVLMPMLNFVVFSIFPTPLSFLLNSPSLGLAHGACLMFDGETYQKLGGHSAVRDQIFEDTRLAQLWREQNQRGLCLDGQQLVRVRMYSSFHDIWKGFQKNFFPAFQRQISFWAFLLFHFVFFLLPFFWLIFSPGLKSVLAVLTVLIIRLVLILRFRQPIWSALFHPFSEAVLLVLGLSSWWRCKSGQGVTWKGRDYHKTV